MSTLVANITTNDTNNSYYIQKNSQHSLKGLLWGSSGAFLTAGALGLTGATVVGVGMAALSALGTVVNDNMRNSIGAAAIPALLALSAAAVVTDYFAVKFTGFCFSNAIHHLGPEFQIIAHKKTH